MRDLRPARSIAMLLLAGAFSFATPAAAGPLCACRGAVDIDFNGDGKSDLIRSGPTGIRIDLLDGVAAIAAGIFPNGGGALALKAVGSFDAGGHSDFVVQGGGFARITFVGASGTDAASTLILSDGGGSWNVVGAADVTGDGIDELLFEGTGPATGAMRIADLASGSPVYRYLATGGGIWSYARAADLNGDGSKDLLFRGSGAANGLLRANRSGLAANVKFLSQGGGAWVLTTTGDFDGSGTEDLADVSQQETFGFDRVRTFDRNGNVNGTGFVANGAGFFTLKAAGDFNDDGSDDLAYDGPLSFRIVEMFGVNPGVQLYPDNESGLFTLRRMADTNGDGRADLITTNAAGDVRIQLSNHDAGAARKLIANAGL